MKKSTMAVYFRSHFQYVGLIKIVGMKNKNELFVYKKIQAKLLYLRD